jgi:hypothetical protein
MADSPELGRVLGGILAALAEARSLGDRYSRDLAALYEKDDLMRLFPVPRFEAAEVEINLPFAVKKVVGGQQVSAWNLVGDQTTRLANLLLSLAKSDLSRPLPDSDEHTAFADVQRILLRELVTLASAQATGDLNADMVATALGKALEAAIGALSKNEAIRKRLRVSANAARAHWRKDAGGLIQEFLKEWEGLKSAPPAQPAIIQVAVTSAELANIPPEMLVRTKLVLRPRNYEWTKVDETKDGGAVRKLVPE